MTPEQFVSLISMVVSLSGLAWLFILFSAHWVDKMRDDLFSLRDEMFIYAADRNILQNPGYRELRNTMNGMIRFAHKISVARIVMVLIVCRVFGRQLNNRRVSQWFESIKTLPEEQVTQLKDFHTRMWVISIGYMVKRSMSARTILFVWRVITFLNGTARRTQEVFQTIYRSRSQELDWLELEAIHTTAGKGAT